MSKINLIVPLFNSNYIEKQLLSIKKVQNKAIKLYVIFVDDGSDENYRNTYSSVIEKFNMKSDKSVHITYFYLGEKSGQNRVCEARNKGVELSIGENIVFIDQETILSKKYFKSILKYINSRDIIIGPYLGYNNLEKNITDEDIDFFIENGYVNKDNFSDFRIDFYKEKQTNNRIWEFFCASNLFIKKDVFLSVGGFDESINTWGDEDTEFGYRLQKAGFNINFNSEIGVLNLSEKLYNNPFKILEETKLESLSNNWLKNYEKHNNPDYKRYIYNRYNHLDESLKLKVSKNFKNKFLNKKNILIHSINGIGLGHIKRTLLIALELFKSDKIGEIIFVTNSKNPFLINNAGYRLIALDYGIEDCLFSNSFEDYESKNFSKINNIINENNIDIIIHDTYFIKKVLDNRIDISHFLILRDSELDYLNSIKSYLYGFKKVFIPHIKEELSQEKLDFYSSYENVIHSGYVFDNLQLNKNNSNKILVSPGYGGDYENTKYFFNYLNELIFSNLDSFKDYEITFVLGKYYYELVAEIEFYPNISISQFDDNLSKSIKESEIFIGRGGYNTLNEVFFTATKSLLFPVERNAENQGDRIDFFINHFGVDFIKRGSYNLERDIKEIGKLINNPSAFSHSLWEREKLNDGDIKKIEFLDGKKVISDGIIKEINKKNILVFKNIFLPKSENFIYEELRLLEGINPIIFTLKMDNNHIFPNNFNIIYQKEFDTLLDLEYPKIKDTDLYLKFLKYLVYLIKKYDIKLIYTEFLFDAYFIVKIKSLNPNIKIISAARGYDIYSFLKNELNNQKLFLDKLDKILVRDNTMKSEILNYGVEEEKAEVVRSVLDFTKYRFIEKDFSKLNIVIGGRFVDKKGILELLDLVNLLSKQNFIGNILLFGDGELKNDILEKIVFLGLVKKIKYVGFLEHKDLLKQINKYNCYINYSKVSKNGDADGVPNLLIENMLLGNLVFSTLVGGIGELIMDNETGIVLSGNIKDDLEKVKYIFENEKKLFENITNNGNKKVIELFSFKNGVKKLEEILK